MKHWVQLMIICLANNLVKLSSQIIDLPLVFTNGVLLTVPFYIFFVLNQPMILGIP